MSIQKWHQLARKKSAVDQQTRGIRQQFRAHRINKEFGQLTGEELLKPVTRRLDKETTEGTTQETRLESPDYTMDEIDANNPFGVEFRLDVPTPELTPPSSPPPSLQPDDDDVDFSRKEWGPLWPVEPEYLHESTLLQTVNQLITKYGNDPNYVVKSKESALRGYSLDDLKKIRDGIYDKRRNTKQQPTVKPLEWETEELTDKLIHQLYISLGSIRAGNSSRKLREQVSSLLDSLVRLGTINREQKQKIFGNY